MAYPIPGYLEHPADLAGNLLAGFQAGSSVARAQSQLQMEAQRAGIEIAERQRQMEMEQIRQRQQMEMQRAYHDATIGLRKEQLDTAQQKVSLATAQAAQKYSAQQSVQRRTQELTDAGMPIDQATRQAFLENASRLSLTGQGVAALTKPPPETAPGAPLQTYPVLDPTTKQPVPGLVSWPSPTGRGYNVRTTPQAEKQELTIPQAAALVEKLSRNPMLIRPPKKTDKTWTPEIQAEYDRTKKIYEAASRRLESIGEPGRGAGARGVAVPLPAKKESLVVGQTYTTAQGPYIWDGEKLVRVKNASAGNP